MGPECFWMQRMGGLPVIMPTIVIIVLLLMVFPIFGRGGVRPPWYDRGHSYVDRPSWESAKDEFEQMMRDILS